MPVLDEQEREALREADTELSHFQEALEAAARSNALDEAFVERLQSTAREAVSRLNQNLPPHVDADSRDEIRRRLIDVLTLRAGDGLELLDVADRALIELEAVRHVVRDVLDEQPRVALRDSAGVIGLLDDWLPSLTVSERARLIGLSDRQLQRRRHDNVPSSQRMQLVAQLIAILRTAWTDQGVLAWFQREHPELSRTRPIDVLDDPDWERPLLLAARGGRVQSAG